MSIVVFFVLSVLVVWCLALWAGISRMDELTHKKQAQEKVFFLAQGALTYAISKAKDKIMDGVKEDFLDPWPSHKKTENSVQISYEPKDNGIFIGVRLFKKGAAKCLLSCFLKRDIKDEAKLYASNWQEHTKP